jgi:osmoprotectant transport system permease protein
VSSRPDRRAFALPLAIGAAALAWPSFVTHAPNRLLSGRPIPFATAVNHVGAGPAILFALCAALLIAGLLRWNTGMRWLCVPAAGGAVALLALTAARMAAVLAAGAAPAARTSFGAGFWGAVVALLLAAAEAARGLRPAALAMGLALAPTAVVIASGAVAPLSIFREYASQHAIFDAALLRHVELVAGALTPTLLIGLPLGVACWRRGRIRRAVLPTLNVVQTIPSIALFGLLMAPLTGIAASVPGAAKLGIGGVGWAPAVVALVLYALLPVVRSTVAGLDSVPDAVRDAARGIGMTPSQAFWRVDLPLAFPVILAGVRVTAVQSVGLAAVSALIGAGGLGAIMFQGLFANAQDLVLLGAIPVILLAVAVDAVFRVLGAAIA